jgi:hypothetical protein
MDRIPVDDKVRFRQQVDSIGAIADKFLWLWTKIKRNNWNPLSH